MSMSGKTPSSPATCIPSLVADTTFVSKFDVESGQVRTREKGTHWSPVQELMLSPANWKSRIGLGETPQVTVEQVRQQKQAAVEAVRETDTQKLEDCPLGYPRLSAFLSSESNFSLYRSFSYLHSRVLLELQDDLAKLEKELGELDEADGTDGRNKNLKIRRFDLRNPRDEKNGFRPRETITSNIHKKLLEYDELMIKARELQAFQKPSSRDYNSVRTWFYNEKPLQDAKESHFIKRKEDLVSLHSGREWSGFDGLIEDVLKRCDCKLARRLFCTQEHRHKSDSDYVYYYSSSRVESFVSLVISSIVFVLLVLPVLGMYILTTMDNNPHGTFQAIGILVVFTLLFPTAMSLLTKARRHELFAAAAAYCAVLVVFISNLSSTGPVG